MSEQPDVSRAKRPRGRASKRKKQKKRDDKGAVEVIDGIREAANGGLEYRVKRTGRDVYLWEPEIDCADDLEKLQQFMKILSYDESNAKYQQMSNIPEVKNFDAKSYVMPIPKKPKAAKRARGGHDETNAHQRRPHTTAGVKKKKGKKKKSKADASRAPGQAGPPPT